MSEFVNAEAESRRAMLIGLAAQTEDKTIAIQVFGPSGLIATARPNFRPHWEATARQLVWPNGARAHVLTPEVPGNIRGVDFHLAWLSELQSWPATQREEAWTNFLLTTRLGYSRTIWDATPKKRHPILKMLLARGEAEPEKHIVVRGTMHENAANLGRGVIEDVERELGGTQRGREEILGEMLDESDGALVTQKWIDDHRRPRPDRFTRRVIGIDCATTKGRGSDRTGIIEVGLGVDGQAHVLADYSGKHASHEWAKIALDVYVKNGCDLIVVETNKGGDLVTQNLRAAASDRGLSVVLVGKEERPHRAERAVNVKEVFARGAKEDRAQPVATAYERGRISHVVGADLASLEDTLTSWEPAPGARSPDDLDALVHAIVEILNLNSDARDASVSYDGIVAMAAELTKPAPVQAANISALLSTGGFGSGGRI